MIFGIGSYFIKGTLSHSCRTAFEPVLPGAAECCPHGVSGTEAAERCPHGVSGWSGPRQGEFIPGAQPQPFGPGGGWEGAGAREEALQSDLQPPLPQSLQSGCPPGPVRVLHVRPLPSSPQCGGKVALPLSLSPEETEPGLALSTGRFLAVKPPFCFG